MSNQLAVIKQELTSTETSKEMAVAMGVNPGDESAMNKVAKYAYGVFSTIQASVGTKQDLSGCNPQSIKATMIEAANRGVYIDGRQHAHLVKYGNNCTFQMGYRGYLAKIKEFYPDADFVVEPVYSGDEVKIWNENGQQNYTHKKAGAFRSGEKDFIGILFAVTYTDNGRLIQRVTDVAKERIDRAKGAAKQKYVWSSDYVEKAKAAAIKNACKQLFASIQGLQDIVDYDNRNNYDPNQAIEAATPVRKTILDNINENVSQGDTEPAQAAQGELVEEEQPAAAVAEPDSNIIDVEVVEEQPADDSKQKELVAEGEKKAKAGWHDYKAWVGTLDDTQKDLVRHKHKEWQEAARKVSKAAQAAEAAAAEPEPTPEPESADTEKPPI